MSRDYADYDDWKGWGADQFMVLSDWLRAYYRQEFQGIPIRGEKVVEVGFGSGTLLAWLQEEGADVHGTEISVAGREMAERRGIKLLDPGFAEAEALAGQFGLVAAFDVLEHLTSREIATLFERAATLLKPGGVFVARFPNGGSPFGRALQHGDDTHVSTLTVSKVRQIMPGELFTIRRAGDPGQSSHGGPAMRVARLVRGLFRTGFEKGLRFLYGLEGSLHPNVVIVAERRDRVAHPLPVPHTDRTTGKQD